MWPTPSQPASHVAVGYTALCYAGINAMNADVWHRYEVLPWSAVATQGKQHVALWRSWCRTRLLADLTTKERDRNEVLKPCVWSLSYVVSFNWNPYSCVLYEEFLSIAVMRCHEVISCRVQYITLCNNCCDMVLSVKIQIDSQFKLAQQHIQALLSLATIVCTWTGNKIIS